MRQRRSFQCRRGVATFAFCAIILGAMIAATPAFAGLGDDVSSVESDRAHMQGTLKITQTQAFARHEIQGPTGTVVREFVSASGKVFAVAWQGPFQPDMRQILSTYFGTYHEAARTQTNSRPGRHPFAVQQPGLVIQAGGHMRSFAGRAYIPQLVPEGTSLEAIR